MGRSGNFHVCVVYNVPLLLPLSSGTGRIFHSPCPTALERAPHAQTPAQPTPDAAPPGRPVRAWPGHLHAPRTLGSATPSSPLSYSNFSPHPDCSVRSMACSSRDRDREENRGRTHLVPAVLVRDVLLQTLLPTEQLRALLTLEQLVTYGISHSELIQPAGAAETRTPRPVPAASRDSPCERTCLLRLLLFWKTLLQVPHWYTRRCSPSCRTSFRRMPCRLERIRLLLRAMLLL